MVQNYGGNPNLRINCVRDGYRCEVVLTPFLLVGAALRGRPFVEIIQHCVLSDPYGRGGHGVPPLQLLTLNRSYVSTTGCPGIY